MKYQRSLTILVILVCFSSTVFAQFSLGGLGGLLGGLGGFGGAGIPVYDSTLMGESLIHTIKFTAQIQQLVQTYEKITATHKHLVYMAQQIKGRRGRYITPETLWKAFSASNAYGTTGPWIAAVNSGLGVAQGWQKATTLEDIYNMSLIPASQRDRRATDVAGLELADGVAISTMENVGFSRAAGVKLDKALHQMEQDVLDDDNDQNTEAAQLNKISALAMSQARSLNDQNKLLVSIAEQGLMRLRQEREAQAYALRNDVAFKAGARQNIDQMSKGFSDAMRGFKY